MMLKQRRWIHMEQRIAYLYQFAQQTLELHTNTIPIAPQIPLEFDGHHLEQFQSGASSCVTPVAAQARQFSP